jgi:hypothetical protein
VIDENYESFKDQRIPTAIILLKNEGHRTILFRNPMAELHHLLNKHALKNF